MSRRAARTLTIAAASAALTAVGGCSSMYQAQIDRHNFDPYAPVASGAGDSLGGALFLHQVQTANAIRFQTSPAFAAELTDH